MPNRLAGSSSPYLLQHQNNPVDWYPWGEEAFIRARLEDKPVFLSVGYSSCHWCHVMEHESFEDAQVAQILNTHFVSIKVDREELPDVDHTYMTAVQMTAGRGGWPMSVFLTPDRKPFFGGTYFPKLDRGRSPGLISVLKEIAAAWKARRKELQAAADELGRAIGTMMARPAPGTFVTWSPEVVMQALSTILQQYDQDNGGFGPSPKFPPHTRLALLLDLGMSEAIPDETAQQLLNMALHTLVTMCMGGIHDHVGGGFHRYSTDAVWFVPHFEKMLSDNALMLRNLSLATEIVAQDGQNPDAFELLKDARDGTVRFLVDDLGIGNGLFGSAIDADTEGEEGLTTTWTMAEVKEVLGADADAFCQVYGFALGGNYDDEASGQRNGRNIPHLESPPPKEAAGWLAKLREVRKRRPQPQFDSKAIVAWNGLAIEALVFADRADLASQCALTILEAEKNHGRLPHQIVGGQPEGDAYLDDYAHFIWGLMHLAQAGDASLFEAAGRLAGEMVQLFFDAELGGFWYSSNRHDRLLGRYKPYFDEPNPSPNAIAAKCLWLLRMTEPAVKTLQSSVGWVERAPDAMASMILAAWQMMATGTLPITGSGGAVSAGQATGSGVGAMAPGGDSAVEESVPTLAGESEVGASGPSVSSGEPMVETASTGTQSASSTSRPEIKVALSTREWHAEADGTAYAVLRIELPEGWHINSEHPPARWMIPTKVGSQPIAVRAHFPEPTQDMYVGTIEIPLTVQLPSGKSDVEFEIQLTYQACTDEMCMEATDKRFDCVAYR